MGQASRAFCSPGGEPGGRGNLQGLLVIPLIKNRLGVLSTLELLAQGQTGSGIITSHGAKVSFNEHLAYFGGNNDGFTWEIKES